jgi:hypothetical protein
MGADFRCHKSGLLLSISISCHHVMISTEITAELLCGQIKSGRTFQFLNVRNPNANGAQGHYFDFAHRIRFLLSSKKVVMFQN